MHRNIDGNTWQNSKIFELPLPKAIPVRGCPYLVISALGIELEFSSLEEVEHFIYVVSQKNMPKSRRLALGRYKNYGPNSHWLSRLLSKLKPWFKRQKYLPILEASINEYKKYVVNGVG